MNSHNIISISKSSH